MVYQYEFAIYSNDKLILFKNTFRGISELDNYDAINVDKTCDIPADYEGVIAVPVSFFDKYNPDQFEIIGKIEPVCRGKRIYKTIVDKKRNHNLLDN